MPLPRFRQLKIRAQLILGFVFTLLCVTVFLFASYPHEQEKQSVAMLRDKVTTMAEMTATGVSVALQFGDFSAVSQSIAINTRDSGVAFVILYSADGEEIASHNPRHVLVDFDELERGQCFELDGRYLVATASVAGVSADYGDLVLGYSLEGLQHSLAQNRRTTLVVCLLILLLGSAIVAVVSAGLTRPLRQLGDAARKISNGDYAVVLDTEPRDEIGALSRAFTEMAQSIRNSIEDVQKLNRSITLILESAGEEIYGVDHDGKTTFVNRSALEMLGYSAEELLNRPIHDVIHRSPSGGTEAPSEECPMYKVLRGDTP